MNEEDFFEKIKLRIGLEIHITLNSERKIFNWSKTYNGEEKPNALISPWELGYPGFLPIINPEVLEKALKLAIILKMKTQSFFLFERKLYNYYDLPKGFQITQNKFPFAKNGVFFLLKNSKEIKIPIHSLQLEEDTAKTLFVSGGVKLDFNRAGNPLVELVTKPIFNHEDDVIFFLKQLQNFLIYYDVSEAKMEKGQMRIDLNYSIKNDQVFFYKTPRYEIKNLNSFSNIKKSLIWEKKKHYSFFLEKKLPPKSCTLNFNEKSGETKIMREKEKYIFVPEYNIPPIKILESDLKRIKKEIPKLSPLKYWKKEVILFPEKTTEILKHYSFPLFLKTLCYLQEKKLLTKKKQVCNKWTNFFFNFLMLSFPEKNKMFFFLKKQKEYLKIFQEWERNSLDNKETNKVLNLIKNEKKTTNFWKEFKEKKKRIKKVNYLQILESIWNNKVSEEIKKDHKKLFSFLFSEFKKKALYFEQNKILEAINLFLKKIFKK